MTSSKHDRTSLSSKNTYDDSLKNQRNPYVSIGIVEAFGLSEISDGSTASPSVQIQIGNYKVTTSPAKRLHGDRCYWGDTHDIDIQEGQPVVIALYSNNACLACLKVDFSRIENFEEKHDFWLRLTNQRMSFSHFKWREDSSVIVTDQMIGNENDLCPRLHLQLRYMDSDTLNHLKVHFESYRTLIGRENYTEFNVKVTRQDGVSWKVKLRYSDIYKLRKEIILVLPRLSDIGFVGKTYFHWLSCVWPRKSQFDEGLIQSREKCMEEFLNATLERMSEISCRRLEELLGIR